MKLYRMANRELRLKMSNGNLLTTFAWLGYKKCMSDKHLLDTDRVIARNTSYTGDDGEVNQTWKFYICNSKSEYLNLIVDNPDCNLCEYIHTSKRKLYFDFDIKKDKPAIDRLRANEILDFLVEKINHHFLINITRDNVIVFSRDKDEIRSLHFIVPKYSTTRENLAIFTKILKEQVEVV